MRADTTGVRGARRSVGGAPGASFRLGVVGTLLVVALVASAPVALAGRKSGSGGGTTTPTNDIWISDVNGTVMAASSQPSPDLRDSVRFGTVVQPLAGWQYPMVAIYCWQDVNLDGDVTTSPLANDDLVYAQLDKPDYTFVMGAGSSPWLSRGGGDAFCKAILYAYPGFHKGDILFLDETDYWWADG